MKKYTKQQRESMKQQRQQILRRLKRHKRSHKAKVYGRQFLEFMVYKVAPGADTETVHLSLDYDFKKEGVHAFKKFLDQYTSSPEDVVTLYVVEDISRPGDAYDRGDDTEIPLDLDAPSAIHIPKYIQKSMKRDNLTNTQQISAYLRKIHGGAQQQKPQKQKQQQTVLSLKPPTEMIRGYVLRVYRQLQEKYPNETKQWYLGKVYQTGTSLQAINYFEDLGYKKVWRHEGTINRDIIKTLLDMGWTMDGAINPRQALKQMEQQQSKQTQKPKQQSKQTQKPKQSKPVVEQLVSEQQIDALRKAFYFDLPKAGTKRDRLLFDLAKGFISTMKKGWNKRFIDAFNETCRFYVDNNGNPKAFARRSKSDETFYRFLQEQDMIPNLLDGVNSGLLTKFLFNHLIITGRTKGVLEYTTVKGYGNDNDLDIVWYTPFLKAPLKSPYNADHFDLDDDAINYALEGVALDWCRLILDIIDPTNYYLHPDRYFFAKAADAFLTDVLPDDYFLASDSERNKILQKLLKPSLKPCNGLPLRETIMVIARQLGNPNNLVRPPEKRVPTDMEILQYMKARVLSGESPEDFFRDRLKFTFPKQKAALKKDKLAMYIRERIRHLKQ